jgi:hypothetical protein
MRHLLILLTVLLVLLLMAFNARGQTPPPANPPDAPQPAPYAQPPDPRWSRIQQLAIGQEILVYSTYGPPLRCRFTGATDAYLFCEPSDSPASAGYRLDRASVINVQIARTVHNWHPAWISSMIAGGLVVGITATVNNNAGDSARDGLIAAGVVGLIGAPLAFLPRDTGGGAVLRPFGFVRSGPRSVHYPHFFRLR